MSDQKFRKVAEAAVAVIAWSAAVASVGTGFYIFCAAMQAAFKIIF